MKESIIAKRAYQFSLDIVLLTRKLPRSYENIIMIKQIIRSSTSIGANIEEALGGGSKKEFIHCMNIAKKEARETQYWLKLLRDLNSQLAYKLDVLLSECVEIINMLTKIVKTSSLKLST